MAGFEGNPEPKREKQLSSPEPEAAVKGELRGVYERDIRPEVPLEGGTVIVYQRNTNDTRTPGPDFGALTSEGVEKTKKQAHEYFDLLFSKMTDKEKQGLDVLFLASDDQLHTPAGEQSTHKRAVETAALVMGSLGEQMTKHGLKHEQLLNEKDRPVEVSLLTDLRMLEESPEYVTLLKQKAEEAVANKRKNVKGQELSAQQWFWIMFEEDELKQERQKMGAEGPDEIADRINTYLSLLKLISDEHHQSHPGRRLLLWAVSHGDTITPYVKNHVAKLPKDAFLPVKTNGGITIAITPDGKAKTALSGNSFEVSFDPLKPDLTRRRKSAAELEALLHE